MESLVHYTNPAHALSLLGVLNEQRLRGQLCDVVLVVGDQKYQAHRSVLAASSEYFQSLFTGRQPDPHTAIQLDFCEPDAFEIVLNYIYSSSLFVDKCSLAAIQELGYSLGIPYLTNIMSTRPQVSYCISRKRLAFSDEDDATYQKRSVIVRQGYGDPLGSGMPPKRGLHQHGRASRQTTAMASEDVPLTRADRKQGHSFGHKKSNDSERAASACRESSQPSEEHESKPTVASLGSISTGHAAYTVPPVRPQLTSSVSFSESQIQRAGLPPDPAGDGGDEQMEPLHEEKPSFPRQQNQQTQNIDRSGPLIKSLLRRSLSMDSPVPVFSPALELKDSQSREESVLKLVTKATESLPSESKHKAPKGVPPLILRSRQHNMDEKEDSQGAEVHMKTEPSSPLPDPSEIIRITVGDNLPVSLRDFQMNFDEPPGGYYNHSAKRKVNMGDGSQPFKKSRGVEEHHFTHDESMPADASQRPGMEDSNEEPGELRPSKMFKCWSCMKVFRSNAGLYRHVNMYHNPEKPYACDICHKRFHTNFKVWTHCQTQHGVVQNPATSSSSYSVLDEKFQRKLIDIVREREIKKALIMKLRRNKQVLQSQPFGRKGRRSRSTYGCPYCGKMFWFQSQFKQHLRMHSPERASIDEDGEHEMLEKRDQVAHLKENQAKDMYNCRLCNEKLSSPVELGEHERGCRYATVCPYCGLRFSSTLVKKDHEAHCKYKKLTCLECMRTFKSSFSIWRHQVEVHNHNMMTVKEQLNITHQGNSGEVQDPTAPPEPQGPMETGECREENVYSDSSAAPMFDSEDSSSYVPEDLSAGHHKGELHVKEEPLEEEVTDSASVAAASAECPETSVWPCEKCGKLFRTHKDLERHQELLCHIKPYICHICHKAFRTNFRLWSHYQSHMASSDETGAREFDRRPSSPSPSPPHAGMASGPPAPPASPPKTNHSVAAAVAGSAPDQDPGGSSSKPKHKSLEQVKPGDDHDSLPTPESTNKPLAPQESDTMFYHAPTLSALTFKRQYMCKLCHRTFKTAFSLWSHEQSHSHL